MNFPFFNVSNRALHLYPILEINLFDDIPLVFALPCIARSAHVKDCFNFGWVDLDPSSANHVAEELARLDLEVAFLQIQLHVKLSTQFFLLHIL